MRAVRYLPWASGYFATIRAGAKEFELVVEVLVAGGELDFLFQIMDWAWGVDGFDRTALGADQVVAVLAWEKQGEISGTFVQSKPADDTFAFESLEQAEDGRLVALVGQAWRVGKLGQGHRAVALEQSGSELFQRFGPAESLGAAAIDDIF